MMKKDNVWDANKEQAFEEFMRYEHAKKFPEVLDDDLPDHMDDWISNMTVKEYDKYVDRFANRKISRTSTSYETKTTNT